MIKYLLLLLPFFANAGTDYKASLFGIKSDGSTLNTRSIQYAVDYIHNNGGGRLVFEVGRYLTGSIHLKSGVGIELKEGAALIGSLNPFDYDRNGFTALLLADSQQNISITGKGVIDGQGRQLAVNIAALVHSGVIIDILKNDRATEAIRPMLIYFRHCSEIMVRSVTLKNSACWVQTYDQCRQLTLDSVRVDSKAYWNNDGVDIVDCNGVEITNCLIDAGDDAVCLKSHDPSASCDNILIRNNTLRSSANAIKFGTASYGGFKHVRIVQNKVYDTYRSAIALEAIDGGSIDDVTVDSLEAINTGNAIFIRAGHRGGTKRSSVSNVHVSNMYIEIAANKADAGYEYEGPVEDQPRNISPPIVLTGLPDALVSNIHLSGITINFPGGGSKFIANRSLDALDSIPELPAKYPEFSMFKELPAWGIYVRHAQDITVQHVSITCAAKDYRTAIVLDDVQRAQFDTMTIKEPGNKKAYYQYKSKEVEIK
jgi:polygalacturonase